MQPLALIGVAVLAGLATWCFLLLGRLRRAQRDARRADSVAARLREELHSERLAARLDPLTGLLNRRAFDTLGAELINRERRTLALMVDLDDFKMINDQLGHAAGDEVLVVVARRLARYAGNDLVARLGGDEFAGLLAVREPADRRLEHVASALADAVAVPMRIAGRIVTVTASVGLVEVQERDRAAACPVTSALRRADAAMYGMKAGRRSSRLLQPELAEIDRWLRRQPWFSPSPTDRVPRREPRTEAGG
jgi:diguanylate cyclase (GGDEF)-like protein